MRYLSLFFIVYLFIFRPPAAQAAILGDFDNDDKVDIRDIQLFTANALQPNPIYDLNTDSVVNIFDFSFLLTQFTKSSTLPGSTPTTNAGLKTKKFHPGHYLQGYPLDTSPQFIKTEISGDSRLQAARGVRVPITWKAFEPERGKYNFALVDEYLEAIGPDKQMFLHWWATDIWAKNCDAATRIPTYMLPHCTKLYNGGSHSNAAVKWWEPGPRAEMIRVLKAIGEHYDKNPQFEGIMFDETNFGAPPTSDISNADFEKAKLQAYEEIHTAIAPYFATSQVIQPLNWLGDAGCTELRKLTDHLRNLGHGISNPDSTPWKALPRGCGTPYTNAPESRPGDMTESHWWSIAVYTIYREYKNTIPIVVGGDASQFENPFMYPRTFNGVPMNAANLTDLLYKQAVDGYTYAPTNEFVPGFGANYILWERNFWSFSVNPSTRETTNAYIDAYYSIISNPNKKTNATCPTNIKCAP